MRRRTPSETIAYAQGYLAALREIPQASEKFRKAMEVQMQMVIDDQTALEDNREQNLEAVARQYYDYVSGDDPCRFDHHGYCQHHGWYDDGPCIAQWIKKALDE